MQVRVFGGPFDGRTMEVDDQLDTFQTTAPDSTCYAAYRRRRYVEDGVTRFVFVPAAIGDAEASALVWAGLLEKPWDA